MTLFRTLLLSQIAMGARVHFDIGNAARRCYHDRKRAAGAMPPRDTPCRKQ